MHEYRQEYVIRRPAHPGTRTLALIVTIAWSGCTGAIGGAEREGGDAPRGTGGAAGASSAPGGADGIPIGPAPPPDDGAKAAQPGQGPRTAGRPVVRLLSPQELRNALEDLFGVTTTDDELPLADTASTGLSSPPSDFLGATDFEKIDRLSGNVALQFVGKVQGGAGRCPDGAGVPACVDALLTAQGRRVFRRPLIAAELDSYKKLYAAEKARKGHDAGLALAVQGLLQSPHFLYRAEIGTPAAGGLNRLTDWEYASALSFFVTRSVPDDTLLQAAEAGQLDNPEGVRQQVRRLLGTRRGKEGVLDFYARWLQLTGFTDTEKDPKLFPMFDGAFKAAALREVTETLEREVLSGQGSFKNLLLTRKGFVDAKLAPIYKVSAPSQPGVVDLDARRSGLFTQVAFLAGASDTTETHPFRVGASIFERVLCQPFPPVPEDALMIPYTPDPKRSRRQNLEAHTSAGPCAACHKVLNPISFTFEAFDPVGRARTTLDGFPIDTTGSITVSRDANGSFADVAELMRLLAASTQVAECHVRQWLRYGLGRMEGPEDVATLQRVSEAFARSNQDVIAMVAELVTSDSFTYRKRQ